MFLLENAAKGVSESTGVGRAETESGEVAVSADGDTGDVDIEYSSYGTCVDTRQWLDSEG